jgi:hypothetical protein
MSVEQTQTEKPAPVPLCTPQIPHNKACDWIRPTAGVAGAKSKATHRRNGGCELRGLVRSEEFGRLKNLITSSGVKHVTVRLVARCRNTNTITIILTQPVEPPCQLHRSEAFNFFFFFFFFPRVSSDVISLQLCTPQSCWFIIQVICSL